MLNQKNYFLHSEGGGFNPQLVSNPEEIEFLIVDLFCGAGGVTTGFDRARLDGKKCALVIACVNHDAKAIESHWKNHPEVVHFEEDIRTLDLAPLVSILEKYRLLYPNAKVILWASLECTNFSKAKGGQSRDADSRTLAEHLDRYILALDPDYIQIENVVEFMSWGPLDENGKPISMKAGQDWLRWRNSINEFGYRDEWREMNSADFGAYTSRNRLFGCFAKNGLPIVWPQPTHSKNGSDKADLYGESLKKWMPVKEVLDFEDEGNSIFGRKKPLVEASLQRIYAGLIKHVAGGKNAFILKYNSFSQKGIHIPPSIDNPLPTIACQSRLGIVQTSFISRYFSGNPKGQVASIENPLGVITTVDHHSIVNASFLTKYYGTGENVSSIEDPAGTLTTKDRFTKIQCNWLDKQYSGKDNHQSIEKPAGTILTSDKHALVSAPFILNPSHGGHTMHVNQPCPVIIARQDKAPLYLVQYSQDTNFSIPIYEGDSDTMIKIKEFMALYGISDIKIRMLKVSELKVIQGFGPEYQLQGNQTDQKKFIGNSVVPHVVSAWCEVMAGKNRDLKLVA
jgi:DNA (cytosine-5)-methyltransferase 1